MNAEEALAWLYRTQLHGIKLGLNQMRRLADALGLQVEGSSPKFLHVAGTNGKGSVCAMLDSICRAAGYRTGLFTSPHLVTFRERIRLNGRMIEPTELATGLSQIRDATANWEIEPTFFEVATALGLIHFQQHQAEIVVLETGMGGRLDATNVVTPAVSILTPIAFDHQQWLGDTMAAIAGEKAGIIKAGAPVVSLPQAEEAARVLLETAALRSTTIEFIQAPCELPVGLAGSHQLWNGALARRALELASIAVAPAALARGLQDVQWPGRFQRLSERMVLDGAHNPAAALRLVETWQEIFGAAKATLVLGVLKDKDVAGVCAALVPIAARVIVLSVQNERTSDPADLRALWRSLAPGIACTQANSLAEALHQAESAPEKILVTGSLFLIGEILADANQSGPGREISSQ